VVVALAVLVGNMTLFRLKKEVIPSGEAELCAGDDSLQFGQETLKLEQKVAGYFEQWREPVYRYLVAAFGNSAQAEDVTQEAFLRLYRRLHAGQSIINARAWVFQVAHNLAVNQIKSRQFITPLDDDTWAELRQSYQDTGPSPEQKLIQQEKF